MLIGCNSEVLKRGLDVLEALARRQFQFVCILQFTCVFRETRISLSSEAEKMSFLSIRSQKQSKNSNRWRLHSQIFFFHRPLEVQQRSNIWNMKCKCKSALPFFFNLDRHSRKWPDGNIGAFQWSWRSVITVFTSLSSSLSVSTERWVLEKWSFTFVYWMEN